VKKTGFWASDAFLGVMVTLAVLVLGLSELSQSLERKAYDVAVQATAREPSSKIAIIAIDKPSLDNIGRWPWSREIMADMVERLAAAKAKVIGTTVLFSEPQRDAGLAYIERMMTDCAVTPGAAPSTPPVVTPAEDGAAIENVVPVPACPIVEPILREAEVKLNTDRRLAKALSSAGNVALPMLFTLGEPIGRPDGELPAYVQASVVPQVESRVPPFAAVSVDAGVIAPLGSAATAIGHLNVVPDIDGAVRTDPLILDYYGQYYPALSLLVAARSLNLGPADIKVRSGESVSLGRLNIATDANTRMLTFFYRGASASAAGSESAFSVDSFFDVASGKVPVEKFRDKIVLIGPTSSSISSVFVTPVHPSMPSVMMLAHSVSSVLSEHFFVAPAWGVAVEYGVFLVIALYLILLLPRLKAGIGAAITLALLVVLLATHFVLMTTQLLWLQLMLPATLLVIGHLLLTTKRFLVTERGKEKSDAESAESNRMLGLAFQGQGQLDMAFDKFRKCPLDEPLMENLYNLGLDFERKRQFNKAESVFGYMADFNPKFRDLDTRLNRAKQMSETVMLGGGGVRSNASLLDASGNVEKPMLGRYQIEKELGKGAMGVVYLGRDPKINRVVAIKTMALAQEFDEDELADVKERFFREAETAGRLNHPHIVTMFDAGEEQDLAYIAMEFLKGRDLVPHTKPDNLMPLTKALSIVARVAEALAYAHENNVVHRDIKPANIMYEPESDQVKVTDFGIARITDSSRTKTGMVLGTPSFMSPEQLAGHKIDGRSDLFSLGVMLYQMACGRLPFEGDSMAQLMYKIANEPHTDIRQINPALPKSLSFVLDKALKKVVTERYQTGAEFAKAIRACALVIEKTASVAATEKS
jgi:eukaryotic-like serine/threonine-protein kinase